MKFLTALLLLLLFLLWARIGYIDGKTKRIPNRWLWPMVILLVPAIRILPPVPALSRVFGALLALLLTCPFGGGDRKFFLLIALLLGAERTFDAYCLAMLCAGVFGAGLLLVRRAQGAALRGTRIALGPFLGLGSGIVLLLWCLKR